MQPEDLKTVCKKYRQKKASDPIDGDPVNHNQHNHYEHDETGDEVNEDDATSTNGSTEHLNTIVSYLFVVLSKHRGGLGMSFKTLVSIISGSLQSKTQQAHDVVLTSF